MNRIRQAIAGKKTYLLAVAAIIGTAVAWSEGTITHIEAIVALYATLTTIFIRAGIAGTVKIATETAVKVHEADREIGRSEDAYDEEERAEARYFNTLAERQEMENRAANPNKD